MEGFKMSKESLKNKEDMESDIHTSENSLDGINNKISEEVISDLEDDDDNKIPENESTIIDESIDLSQSVAKYYEQIFSKASRKPERDYQHSVTEDDFRSKFEIKFDTLKPEEITQYGRQSFKEEDFTDYKIQKSSYVFKQEESENLIQENLINIKIKKDGAFNIPSSDIIVTTSLKNKDSKNINLSDFLPKGYRFAPSVMQKTEYDPDLRKDKLVAVDSTTYKGTGNIDGEFSVQSPPDDPDFKKILYGNLTEKGGILSLLHEVSHAWQNVYYGNEKNQGLNLSNFMEDVRLGIILSESQYNAEQKLLKEAETNKDFEPMVKIFTKPKEEELSKLEKLGVIIENGRAIHDMDRGIEEDEFSVSMLNTDGIIVIKKDKINKLLKDYEKQERYAWAYAIKVLKFLREQGIDLEPQLKNSEDFEEIVHGALSSYSDSIKYKTGISNAFTNKYKKDNAFVDSVKNLE